jgi:hypothetical protein
MCSQNELGAILKSIQYLASLSLAACLLAAPASAFEPYPLPSKAEVCGEAGAVGAYGVGERRFIHCRDARVDGHNMDPTTLPSFSHLRGHDGISGVWIQQDMDPQVIYDRLRGDLPSVPTTLGGMPALKAGHEERNLAYYLLRSEEQDRPWRAVVVCSALRQGDPLAEPGDDRNTCSVILDRFDGASARVRQIHLPDENIPRLIDLAYRLLVLLDAE